MVLTIPFAEGFRFDNRRCICPNRPGVDDIPTSVMVDPAKKKLWIAFYNAFEKIWWAPDEVKALDELKVAVVASFQEAQNALDKALASEKKEELEAVTVMPTDMVPGAVERRRKKNGTRKRKREKREEVEADRAVAADTGSSDDERRGKKNEMTERKRKKLSY
ncbi:uncharacterized protein [Medicago truncatula]|uniref:uncharacterized protein n=1 Tax=Medicago truncatula TaxID=3880 RepID=UPI00196879D5|nr:uncharacterized protein LOC120577301 [Medicago truncatula]